MISRHKCDEIVQFIIANDLTWRHMTHEQWWDWWPLVADGDWADWLLSVCPCVRQVRYILVIFVETGNAKEVNNNGVDGLF